MRCGSVRKLDFVKMIFVGAMGFGLAACGAKGGDADPRADSLATAAAAMIADTGLVEVPTVAYMCGEGVSFLAKVEREVAWLTTKNGMQALPVSASGADYTDGKDKIAVVGSEAHITADGKEYQNCQEQPGDVPWVEAKLRGIHFRAAGQSPAWSIDVVEGKTLSFKGADGAVVTVPAPIPTSTNATSTGAAVSTYKTDRIVMESQERRCNLDGQSVPWTVTATVDGKKYSGCGKNLR